MENMSVMEEMSNVNTHPTYRGTKLPKPLYLDQIGTAEENKTAFTNAMDSVLKAIHENYCDLPISEKSTTNTEVLKEKTEGFFSSKKSKVETTKIVTPSPAYDDLVSGKIAVGKPVDSKTTTDGRERLAKLLDDLKNVTSIQEILAAIDKSGCLKGTNFPAKIGPTLLQMHYLQASFQLCDSNEQPLGTSIEKNDYTMYCVSVYDALSHEKLKDPSFVKKYAILVCKEAAEALPFEETIQQQMFAGYIFDGQTPPHFKGDMDIYNEVYGNTNKQVHAFGF